MVSTCHSFTYFHVSQDYNFLAFLMCLTFAASLHGLDTWTATGSRLADRKAKSLKTLYFHPIVFV